MNRLAIQSWTLLVLASLCVSAAWSADGRRTAPTPVATASPIDDEGLIAVVNAKAATAAPYNPSSVTVNIPMEQFTNFVVWAEYPRAETLTTDPIVYAWSAAGDEWIGCKDAGGVQAITLADGATDEDDGATWKSTLPSDAIDARGGADVRITVQTAAVASGGGAVRIRIRRF
jgi:hypothetical protein